MTSKRSIRRQACIGEVMIELASDPQGQIRLGIAGDTYNTAVYLKRLLPNADTPVSYLTALGADRFSARILADMAAHGIDATHIEQRADKSPGLYAIDTDEAGERSFTYWRSDSAARTLFSAPCKVTPDVLDQFDLVYLSAITLAVLPVSVRVLLAERIDRFRAAGGWFAFDSNYRPTLWEDCDTARDWTMRYWSLADLALPSVDDEMALFGESSEDAVLARLAAAGVTRGALKRGAEGPLSLADRTVPDGLARVARVIDSTAAGDSFNAGYLAAIASGCSDHEAMRRGHNLAARVIAHRGAIIPIDAMAL
ncbi:sugar kinase [Ruegeria sp. 2012CJ41-6]|uniref:Sugar kinase n=1 Tax=Ruegeria spongiae TaxID=2942209 RepID=A0ABT0Q076_9RHOB|nr:sugar kinase [Ruegeria spongiae]MCL6283268.1 sugar kinase [Ruegeria spongiae]